MSGPAALSAALVITLWHAYGGAEAEGLARSLDEANAALAASAVRIEALAIPFDVFHQKLDTAIPRGHGPDLFIGAHDRLGDWRRRGLVVPVEAEGAAPADGAAAADRPRYLPGLVDALADEEGRLTGWPLAFKGLVLYRATDLAPEPLGSLEAIEALAPRLPEGAFALCYDTGSLFFHAPFLLAAGGGIFEDGEQGGYRVFDDQARASYALAQDLVARGVVPREASSALAEQLFNRGRAAAVISGPWFAGAIALPAGRFAVEPLPSIRGRRAGSLVTVEGLFVSASARDLVAARLAARALEEAGGPRAAIGLQPPARADAYEPGAPPLPALVAAQRAALVHGLITPSRREMTFVWEPVGGLLRDALDRGTPLDAAIARARTRLAVISRPPPPPADPLPYAIAVGLGGLATALVLARRALRAPTRAAIARARPAYLLSLPAWLAMLALVVLPFAAGAALSLFTHADGRFTFSGLGNFRDILLARDFPVTDPLSFYFTLAVTVLWTVTNVALHAAIGLGLALLLRKPWLRLRGVFRVLLILPWAVPSYITALAWRGLFDTQLGAINHLLGALGVEPVGWFQSFLPAFAANLATNTWLGFPFMLVVSLGALQAIPPEHEEVARLEGLSRAQAFRYCVWPAIRPALVPALLLGSVWTFNMFNVVYLVSGGEPGGATEILISEAYKWAFQRQHRYGYAAAYAVLIFGILLVYGRLLLRERGRPAPEAAP